MLNKMTVTLPRRLALFAVSAGFATVCTWPVAVHAQAVSSRIGFITTERLMKESKPAREADAKIEAEFSKRQKAIQEMVEKYKTMSERYERDAPTLMEAERIRRNRELLDLEHDVKRTQRTFNEDLLQRKSDERANIAQRAYKLIEQIARQENLDIVLQEAAWVSDKIDITDKVLKQLEK